MRPKMLIKWLLAAAAVAAVFPAPVNGDTVPALWGVDKKDGNLFSFGDYTNPIDTFTDFGRLKCWKDGELKSFDHHIEAFTVSPAGVAYMATNHDIARFDDAVLVSLDLYDVTTDGPKVIDFIGQFDLEFDRKLDSGTGLSFDPLSGDLYALLNDDGTRPSMVVWWLMN